MALTLRASGRAERGTRILHTLPEAGHRWRMTWLLLTLPLFAGTFHYVNDTPPLYLLSKLWPLLTLPFAVIGFARLQLPARELYFATLAYVMSIPPLLAMVHFNSSIPEALQITVKFLPFTVYFSLSLLLAKLRPSAAEIRRCVSILGIATFAVMALLWVVIPQNMYRSEFGISTIFVGGDPIRGNRIQLPIFFGLLYIFQVARNFSTSFRLIELAKLLIAYTLLLIIVKERVPIAFSLAVVILGFTTRLMASRLHAVLLLGCLGCAALTLAVIVLGAGVVEEKLGGSLLVRIDTVIQAWDFLRDDPWRWLFGVGSTTQYATLTLNQVFRNPAFFLSDIGWLGVIFEIGVVGALAVLAIYIFAIHVTEARAHPDDGVSFAIADHAVYLLVASSIYSSTFLPGEVASLTALAIYLGRLRTEAAHARPARIRRARAGSG